MLDCSSPYSLHKQYTTSPFCGLSNLHRKAVTQQTTSIVTPPFTPTYATICQCQKIHESGTGSARAKKSHAAVLRVDELLSCTIYSFILLLVYNSDTHRVLFVFLRQLLALLPLPMHVSSLVELYSVSFLISIPMFLLLFFLSSTPLSLDTKRQNVSPNVERFQ